ncbi:unnamed protein product, partial [Brenthis ino]
MGADSIAVLQSDLLLSEAIFKYLSDFAMSRAHVIFISSGVHEVVDTRPTCIMVGVTAYYVRGRYARRAKPAQAHAAREKRRNIRNTNNSNRANSNGNTQSSTRFTEHD